MSKIFILLFAFFGTSCCTDEEMKIKFVKSIMKCNKDIAVEPQHLLSLHKHVLPDDPATACLLACAYKESGTIDDKGMYSLDTGYKVADKNYANDPVNLENAKKFVDACSKVNDSAVKDGEKGCERSGLLFKCMVENAPKFGFKV